MTVLSLLLLACITFTTRYLFIHPGLPLTLSKRMQRLLGYSAPALLTAIWVPIILVKEKQLALSITSPYLLGAIVAIALAYRFRSIYVTAIVSGAVFILAQQLLN